MAARLSACVIWNGAKTGNGYGAIWRDGRQVGAHRAALEARLGRPIKPGHFACHLCNTPLCVNPEHLYEGTPADNARDKNDSPKAQVGENNGRSKLSLADVHEARRLRRESGVTYKSLAERYGVSYAAIYYAVNRVTWAD